MGNLAKGIHVNIDPVMQKYLALFPLANGPVNGRNPDKAQFVFASTQKITENFATIRLDHRIGDKDSLFATYQYDNTPLNTTDGFGFTDITSATARHIADLEETHIFSLTLVSSSRLGFNQNNVINYSATGSIIRVQAEDAAGRA